MVRGIQYRQERHDWPAPNKTQIRCAAFAISALIVYGSLLPFRFQSRPLEDAVVAIYEMPFFDPTILSARGDWVISTVSFAVLSFLWMAALCVDRRSRVAWKWALPVMACVFTFSVLIEFLQVFFPRRTVSFNDIMMESIGGGLGVAGWLIVGQRVSLSARRLSSVTTVSELARLLLPCYLVAIFVVQLMPFDFVIGFGEIAAKWDEDKIRIVPGTSIESFGWASVAKWILTAVCFMPLGALTSIGLSDKRQTGPRRRLLWLTFATPAIIEVGQLFVYSRTFDATDIALGILGVAMGLSLGRLARFATTDSTIAAILIGTKARFILGLMFVVWFGAVVYFFLWPFNFSRDPSLFTSDHQSLHRYGYRHFAIAPFVDYYWGSKYNALDQFVRKSMSFVPLGFLGALWIKDCFSRTAVLPTLVTALVVAVFLESGRYFLPSRIPSSTDVLIACAGAWLGFWITLRFRMVLWAERELFSWLRNMNTNTSDFLAPPAVSPVYSAWHD